MKLCAPVYMYVHVNRTIASSIDVRWLDAKVLREGKVFFFACVCVCVCTYGRSGRGGVRVWVHQGQNRLFHLFQRRLSDDDHFCALLCRTNFQPNTHCRTSACVRVCLLQTANSGKNLTAAFVVKLLSTPFVRFFSFSLLCWTIESEICSVVVVPPSAPNQ